MFLLFLKLIQISAWDNNIYLYNISFGAKIDVLSGHSDAVTAMVYIKSQVYNINQNSLYSSSWDCTIKKWEWTSKNLDQYNEVIFLNQTTIFDNDSQINCLVVSEDQLKLVIGDSEGIFH